VLDVTLRRVEGVSSVEKPGWRRAAASELGMTLIELMVAMAILLVVVGAIVDAFASATKTESDQIARADAQTNARLALETMRRDIHCAIQSDTSVTGVLLLHQPLTVPCAQATAVSTVTWCTTASAGQYVLRRSTAGTCDASSMIKAKYLTTNTIWSDGCTAGTTGRTRAIAVDLQVSVTAKTPSAKRYRLKDAIALRNGSSLCP
jgi:prepilin-type N-terminal cleavage/methylation domain-containing protein